ncbi:ankyrin repeat-containing protein At5g02620-like [Mangifera indica]|uniref:ankyrin repeat-containing protein At5g02620-like n=1 Tax=Mangifera indica TaxID=29780 RepID=UPI001CF97F3F|nr:ankyrin repeat-containing protein At5g02620-like [Mangifera indica]
MSRGNELGSESALPGPYWAALNDDWESLKDFYMTNVNSLSLPVTASKDNGFHLAVFSKSKEPLQSLLGISKEHSMVRYGYLEKNSYGNTPLHEAALNGNLEAVEALVTHHRRLIAEDIEDSTEEELQEAVNGDGETPLFLAAAFGRKKVVKFLAEKSLKEEYSKLKNIHRQNIRSIKVKPKPKASNELPGAIQGEITSEPEPGAIKEETFIQKPNASILDVAIIGHHFDSALYLLNLDESLAALKSPDGRTSLHLLAAMPSAFESGYQWGTWIHRVIYSCLPIGDDDEKATTKISKGWLKLLGKICALVRSDILEEKRKHKLAFKLAETLITKDSSWDDPFDKDHSSKGDYKPIPLLQATEKGIVEIVNKILEIRPQLVEHCNAHDQNILHVAIKHRRLEIFNHVKNMKKPMTRLVGKVDTNANTILHHAADMEPETAERHPEGPVYQLQEELKWYKRVEEIAPPHYVMFCKERFNSEHNKLLGEAQIWIKETSESCSVVAVLVATVVFAAAYTVPGGSNEQGHPVFLNSALFLLFTVMDVLGLACSLASVVMFLSILVSPYTYEEFHHKLPGKLRIGFTLLFISLTTTMISFAATILLIIRSEKPNRTTTLIYTAAFLPVSIFALMSFPMYPEFEKTLLLLYLRLSKNWRVTKSPPPKKSASRQGRPSSS